MNKNKCFLQVSGYQHGWIFPCRINRLEPKHWLLVKNSIFTRALLHLNVFVCVATVKILAAAGICGYFQLQQNRFKCIKSRISSRLLRLVYVFTITFN